MNTTDRMLIAALFGVLIAFMGWLLQTVSTNSGRISVVEQRADTLERSVWEMKDEIRDHRKMTERAH